MELHHYFLGLIGSVCVVHLLAAATQLLSKLHAKQDSTTNPAVASGERDDWYVFFHCADLLGTNRASSQSIPEQHNRLAATGTQQQKKTQRSRMQARM